MRWCCGGGNSSARLQNQHHAQQSQQVAPTGRQVGDSNERTVSFSAQLTSSMGRNRAPSRQLSEDDDAPMDETPLLCMSPLNHACTSAGGGTDKEEGRRQDHWGPGPMLLRQHKMVLNWHYAHKQYLKLQLNYNVKFN
jgi:hypothetical protein